MSKELQIGFKVKGLAAPEKDMIFHDYILIRGVPFSDASYVFFKVKTHNNEDKDKIREEFLNVLRCITQVYGLVTNIHLEVLSSSVMADISPEIPFGHTKYDPDLQFIAVIEEEQRKKNIPFLKKSMNTYAVSYTHLTLPTTPYV